MGERFSAGAYLILFLFLFLFFYYYYFFFFFFFCTKSAFYITYERFASAISAISNVFVCLYCGLASQSTTLCHIGQNPSGYKPILWEVNDHRTVLQNLTVRSGKGPPIHVIYVGQ